MNNQELKSKPADSEHRGGKGLSVQRLVSGIRSWWVTSDDWGTTGKECVTIFAITQALLIPFYVGWVIFIR
jgi:hypothetical protein